MKEHKSVDENDNSKQAHLCGNSEWLPKAWTLGAGGTCGSLGCGDGLEPEPDWLAGCVHFVLRSAMCDLWAFWYGCHASIKGLIKKMKDIAGWVIGRMGLINTMTRNSWCLNTSREAGKRMHQRMSEILWFAAFFFFFMSPQ